MFFFLLSRFDFYMIRHCLCPIHKCLTEQRWKNKSRDEHETVANNVVPIERLLTANGIAMGRFIHCACFFSRSVIIAHLISPLFYGKLIHSSILFCRITKSEKETHTSNRQTRLFPIHKNVCTIPSLCVYRCVSVRNDGTISPEALK